MRKEKDRIRKLFTDISPRYDFLSSLLSLGIDRFWREMAVAEMPDEGPFLDLCSGTLELSILLLKKKKTYKRITALDFCYPMLVKGKRKLSVLDKGSSQIKEIQVLVGDGECLPLKGDIYQGVIIGFGLRNLTDRISGLKEAFRVLKPGGIIVVLEFSLPVNPIFRWPYLLYFCYILPSIGNLFVKGDKAYNQLRDSVLKFPDRKALAAMMLEAGFINIRYKDMTFGIVSLYCGNKPIWGRN